MRFTTYIFFIGFLIFSSCKDKEKKNSKDDNIQIQVSAFDGEKIDLQDFLELKRTIVLETGENILISGIDKIFNKNNRIYILDKSSNTVFIFDENGRFLHKIADQGKGPQEYYYIFDANWDPVDNTLVLLTGKKLLIYSSTGDFIRTDELPEYFNHFRFISKDSLIFSSSNSSNNKQFHSSDRDLNSFSSFGELAENSWNSNQLFSSSSDALLYSLPLQRKIFTVKGAGGKVLYSVNFNGKFISKEFLGSSFEELRNARLEQKGEKIIDIRDIILIDNLLYFTYNYKYNVYSAFFDTDSTKLLDAGILVGFPSNPFLGNSVPIGQTATEFIFEINPGLKLSHYKKLKTNPEYSKLVEPYKDIFKNLKDNDLSNPVLFFYGVK